MEIVEEIVMKRAFGGGREADESASLTDMKYAERLILNDEFLKAFGKLKVATTEKVDGKDVIKGGSILIDVSELKEAGYDGGIAGAAHKFNQEFVALEMPGFGTSYKTDDAPEVTEEVEDPDTHQKTIVKTTPPNKLRIYRISEKFDPENYACDASSKVKVGVEKEVNEVVEGKTVKVKKLVPINNYHEPTTGMRLRADAWLEQNVDRLAKVLAKTGLTVVAK